MACGSPSPAHYDKVLLRHSQKLMDQGVAGRGTGSRSMQHPRQEPSISANFVAERPAIAPPYRLSCDQESDANSLKWLTLGPDEFMYPTTVLF